MAKNDSFSAEVGEPAPIVCRCNPRLVWMVILGVPEAAGFAAAPWLMQLDPPPHAPIWAAGLLFWPVAALMGAGVLWVALDLVRGEIRADGTGLSWRHGLGQTKSARWDEIGDFYFRVSVSGSRVVETPVGEVELSRTYSNTGAVADLVAARAVNAPSRAWEVRGFRRGDTWSVELSPWSKTRKWFAPLMSAALMYLVIAMPWLASSQPGRGAPISLGTGLDVAALVIPLLLAAPIGAIFVWVVARSWRERGFAWRHRDEVTHLDQNGLLHQSEGVRVAATWDEIRAVEPLEKREGWERVRVRTAGGDFVLWRLPEGSVWPIFRARCQIYAPAALEAMRQSEAAETLDGALEAPQCDARGAQIFTFRTRGNRLALACVSSLLLFAPVLYLVILYGHFDEDAPFAPAWPLFGGALLLSVLLVGALWLWFSRARLIASDDGLELRSPFRAPRFVQWRNVESIGHDFWGDWLKADGRKIYFVRVLPLARREAFDALVKQRRQIR